MDVEEPVIKRSHAVEDLEIKKPEHAEDEKYPDKINDRQDCVLQVKDEGCHPLDRAGLRGLDVSYHQGHGKSVDPVRETFKIDLGDGFFYCHDRIPFSVPEN